MRWPYTVLIGVEEAFSGVIDLIDFKAYIYEDESGEQYQERELNPDERAKAQELRNLLLERLAEYDDNILEKYLEAREISPAEIRSSLRKSCIANQIVPVLCGSSFKNKGVQMLLDAVVDYLPPLLIYLQLRRGYSQWRKRENKA